MIACLGDVNPEVIGNEYLTIGVVERKDWRDGNTGKMRPSELIDRTYVFKDVLDFELVSYGWCLPEKR